MDQAEWFELESDPGLFTLLLEDFGVKGVQVEEIYDLSQPITELVYGFIFLFRWDNSKRKSSRRTGRGSAGSNTSLNNTGPAVSTTTTTNGSSTHDLPRLGAALSKDATSTTTVHLVTTANSSNSHTIPDRSAIPHGLDPLDCTDELFFARQTVQNSCATHALLSVLLNRPELELGPVLSEFLRATRHLTPDAKGTAIGSMPQLAQAHNRHATKPVNHVPTSVMATSPMPSPSEAAAAAVSAALSVTQSSSVLPSLLDVSSSMNSSSSVSTTTLCTATSADTFHFVSFVPFGGQLYELDGLKPDPINHGPLSGGLTQSRWTEQCVEILKQRMQEQDVHHSLMVVVPDRRLHLTERMQILDKNCLLIQNTLLEKARLQSGQSFLGRPLNGLGEPGTSCSPPCSDWGSGITGLLEDGQMTRNGMAASQGSIQPSELDHESNTERLIKTRSVTRLAATSFDLPTQQSPVDSSTAAAITTTTTFSDSIQRQPAPSSNSGSFTSIATCLTLTDVSRKRSSSSQADGEAGDDSGGECAYERKRRLLDDVQQAPSTNDSPEEDGEDAINAKSLVTTTLPFEHPHMGCMNKILESIVSSVDSPLLRTLSRTMADEVEAYTSDWGRMRVSGRDDDSGGGGGGDGAVGIGDVSFDLNDDGDMRTGSYREDDEDGDVSDLHSSMKSRCRSISSVATELGKLEPLTDSCESAKPGKQTKSFTSPFYSQSCVTPPVELTKPLTIDTELWLNTSTTSHDCRLSQFATPNGPVSPTTSSTAKATSKLRPHTRALTRAGVHRPPSPLSESLSPTKSPTSFLALGSGNGIGQSKCQTVPSSTDAGSLLSATRSGRLSEQQRLMDGDEDVFVRCTTPDDNLMAESNHKIAESNNMPRSTPKYPTRSSTRRSTLASHNLAHLRGTSNPSSAPTQSSPIDSQASEAIPLPTQSLTQPAVSDPMRGSETRRRSPPLTVGQLDLLLSLLQEQVKVCRDNLTDEEKKRETYRIEDGRRIHNYAPFIRAFLVALVENGLMEELVWTALHAQNSTSTVVAVSSSSNNNNGCPPASITAIRSSKPTEPNDRMDSTVRCVDALVGCASSRSQTPPLPPHSTPNPIRLRNHQRVSMSKKTSLIKDDPIPTFTDPKLVKSEVTSLNDPSDVTPNLQSGSSAEEPPIELKPEPSESLPPNTIAPITVNLESDVFSTSFTDDCTSDCVKKSDRLDLGEQLVTQSYSPVVSSSTNATSTAGASNSSCSSTPQSPQSSTSSRSVVCLRPRPHLSASRVAFTQKEGNISRQSLRPRLPADRSRVSTIMGDARGRAIAALIRRKHLNRSSVVKNVERDSGGAAAAAAVNDNGGDSGSNCKTDVYSSSSTSSSSSSSTATTNSANYLHRARKRRLC